MSMQLINFDSPSSEKDWVESQITRIIERAQAEDLQFTGAGGLLPDMIDHSVEAFLNVDMTAHVGYEKHSAQGRGSINSRNRSASKSAHTTAGPVELDVPRDRNGTFDPITVPKGTSVRF